jgi:hypothetical protein
LVSKINCHRLIISHFVISYINQIRQPEHSDPWKQISYKLDNTLSNESSAQNYHHNLLPDASEHIWWWLFQKRVMRIKLEIYFFTTVELHEWYILNNKQPTHASFVLGLALSCTTGNNIQ